jgi:hypothetical protein
LSNAEVGRERNGFSLAHASKGRGAFLCPPF